MSRELTRSARCIVWHRCRGVAAKCWCTWVLSPWVAAAFPIARLCVRGDDHHIIMGSCRMSYGVPRATRCHCQPSLLAGGGSCAHLKCYGTSTVNVTRRCCMISSFKSSRQFSISTIPFPGAALYPTFYCNVIKWARAKVRTTRVKRGCSNSELQYRPYFRWYTVHILLQFRAIHYRAFQPQSNSPSQ